VTRTAPPVGDHLGAVLYGVLEVLDVERRFFGIDHFEVDDRIHRDGDVVFGDGHLARQIAVAHSRIDADHRLKHRPHHVETGAQLAGEAPERELERRLPLVHLPQSLEQVDAQEKDQRHQHAERDRIHASL
jgi:hypothetical protein